MFKKYQDIAMAIHHHADLFYFEGSRNHADYFPAWDALKELKFNAVQRYFIVKSGWKKANLLQDYNAATSYELNRVLEIAKREMMKEQEAAFIRNVPCLTHRAYYKEGHKTGLPYDEWLRRNSSFKVN